MSCGLEMTEMETKNNLISKRASIVSSWEDFLNKYLSICNSDMYDEIKNKKGYINLGTAVNNMCQDIILPRLTSKEVWYCNPILLQYWEGYGIARLRKALATLMTHLLKANKTVNPDDLFCTTGVTSGIDLLAHCIADPGDVIMAPTPVYGRIYTDLKQRSNVDLWPIHIITEENPEEPQILTLEKIKKSYASAIAQNRVVRGIILINPSNPLGDVYSPDLLMDILLFCKEHQLHAIIDEVYALSVYPESMPFHSVVQFPSLPDTEKTHVLYGLSKDFGISGLRIGVIYTQCKVLQKCLIQLSFFQTIPFPVMDIAARFIEDLNWCEQHASVNQNRLSQKYTFFVKRLEKMGLQIRKADAGFFVWVNFGKICGSKTFKQEEDFFIYLLEKARLYIVPGKEFFCAQPGWFRITFSTNPDHAEEGLNRLEEAIKSYKLLNP